MQKFAVITGDIVGSASIDIDERENLVRVLKESFGEINESIIKDVHSTFEIFRGDSFQAVLRKPELSLIVSILIRARLRSENVNIPVKKKNWDARLAIGIGDIEFSTDKTVESDGQAFLFSGRDLDNMKNTGKRLRILTPWDEVNAEMNVSLAFADSVISNWSKYQAQVFYYYLLKNEKQKELAERIKISQPAIHQRLVTGNVECIDLLRIRFENLISSKL